MLASEVLATLDALEAAGLRVWSDGGWGVDALLGHESRPHEDVDVVVELGRLSDVLHALAPLGYSLAEDHLPVRAVLRTADGRQVDLHPVTFDDEGTGWQRNASPDGGDCPYPAGGFGSGRILGREVPCLTVDLQLEHHQGYEPRDRDRKDVAALAATFGSTIPYGDTPASTEPPAVATGEDSAPRPRAELVELASDDAARDDVLAVLRHLAWRDAPDELVQIAAPYRRGEQRLFGLELDGRIVCCVGMRDTTNGAELRSLVTLPDHRRQGLASRLIDLVASSLEVRKVWAETDDDAVGFYRSNGFSVERLGETHPGVVRYRCTRTSG